MCQCLLVNTKGTVGLAEIDIEISCEMYDNLVYCYWLIKYADLVHAVHVYFCINSATWCCIYLLIVRLFSSYFVMWFATGRRISLFFHLELEILKERNQEGGKEKSSFGRYASSHWLCSAKYKKPKRAVLSDSARCMHL